MKKYSVENLNPHVCLYEDLESARWQKMITCSRLLIVIGRVAELEAVPKAVARAGPMEPMNLGG